MFACLYIYLCARARARTIRPRLPPTSFDRSLFAWAVTFVAAVSTGHMRNIFQLIAILGPGARPDVSRRSQGFRESSKYLAIVHRRRAIVSRRERRSEPIECKRKMSIRFNSAVYWLLPCNYSQNCFPVSVIELDNYWPNVRRRESSQWRMYFDVTRYIFARAQQCLEGEQ